MCETGKRQSKNEHIYYTTKRKVMSMIGINPDVDYLYDPQQARVVCFCVCCGRVIYSMSTEICDKCRMDMELVVD